MDTSEFREKIYGPYSEAWKIIKLIQFAGQSEDDDEVWQDYMRAVDNFNKRYGKNLFVEDLVRLLIDAGDSIAKMNGGKDAIQSTGEQE